MPTQALLQLCPCLTARETMWRCVFVCMWERASLSSPWKTGWNSPVDWWHNRLQEGEALSHSAAGAGEKITQAIKLHTWSNWRLRSTWKYSGDFSKMYMVLNHICERWKWEETSVFFVVLACAKSWRLNAGVFLYSQVLFIMLLLYAVHNLFIDMTLFTHLHLELFWMLYHLADTKSHCCSKAV